MGDPISHANGLKRCEVEKMKMKMQCRRVLQKLSFWLLQFEVLQQETYLKLEECAKFSRKRKLIELIEEFKLEIRSDKSKDDEELAVIDDEELAVIVDALSPIVNSLPYCSSLFFFWFCWGFSLLGHCSSTARIPIKGSVRAEHFCC
ncbi:hypothetical protein U1Q18_043668 [Sarracenia purpurea var. burkii]